MKEFVKIIRSPEELKLVEVVSNNDSIFKLSPSDKVNYAVVRCEMRGNKNNLVVLCSEERANQFIVSTTKIKCRREGFYFEGVYKCTIQTIDAINNKNKVNEIKRAYSNTEKLISKIIESAIRKGASDIHVQLIKSSSSTTISFRIKGELIFQKGYTFKEGERILNALFQKSTGKNGASLNFDVITSIPVVWDDDINKSLRVECAPNALYFKSIWRLFGNINTANVSYKSLGYDNSSCDFFERLKYRSIGAVLITGPVGSGKTTTMYSHLNNVSSTRSDRNGHPICNIASIEDPVEQIIRGADQRQIDANVNNKGEATDEAVASLLRSDPDIIFMGEVRYQAQADVLSDIGMIGSMGYGTLHADTHVGAIKRLRNKFKFDADYFDVNGSLTAIVTQRLVKKLCDKCCLDIKGFTHGHPDDVKHVKYYLSKYIDDFSNLKFINKYSTCQSCGGSGTSGRVLIYEIYNPNDNLETVASHYMKGEYSKGYKAFMEADNSNGIDGVTLGERCLGNILNGNICAFEGANLIASYPVPQRCEIKTTKFEVVND